MLFDSRSRSNPTEFASFITLKIGCKMFCRIFRVEGLSSVLAFMTARNVHNSSPLPSTISLEQPLLDTRALSRILGVEEQTLRQWRCAGIGPDYIKLGPGPKAEVRYTLKDVETYLAHHRRATAVRAFVAEEQNERL
jgi:hypothetical protein